MVLECQNRGQHKMQIIIPSPSGSIFLSSSIPQDECGAWSSVTSYSAGDYVIRPIIHLIYKSLVNANLGAYPEVSPGLWEEIRPTNQGAMLDLNYGTSTIYNGNGGISATFGRGTLEDSLKTGYAFFGVVGQTLTIEGYINNSWVVTHSIGLEQEYSGVPFIRKTIVINNQSVYTPEWRFTLTVAGYASNAPYFMDGFYAKLGAVMSGNVYDIGATQRGLTFPFVDYSNVKFSETGAGKFKRGGYATPLSASILVDDTMIDYVEHILISIRSTPCTWIPDELNLMRSLLGWLSSYSIRKYSKNQFFIDLEVKGILTE
jgi:hypothetical protein